MSNMKQINKSIFPRSNEDDRLQNIYKRVAHTIQRAIIIYLCLEDSEMYAQRFRFHIH